MSKRCFKCGEIKPLTEFYKHKQMADGHLNKCKSCTKSDVHQNREANIEKIREYDRDRSKLPHRVKARIDYAKKFKAEHPEKRKAHHAVNNAIRDGRMKKPDSCSRCGSTFRIEGHHTDYSKPLDVVWLCSACHSREHHS